MDNWLCRDNSIHSACGKVAVWLIVAVLTEQLPIAYASTTRLSCFSHPINKVVFEKTNASVQCVQIVLVHKWPEDLNYDLSY